MTTDKRGIQGEGCEKP